LPDLTISTANAPAFALASQTIIVRWTTRNAGAGGLAASSWSDSVSLVMPGGDEKILTKAIAHAPLAGGASYEAQATVTLPALAPGTYDLLVRDDSDGFVVEGQNEGNNSSALPLTIASSDIDLRVASVNIPFGAFSGQPLSVSWTVTNAGTSGTLVSQWTDYVVLSRDQILDSTDRILGWRAHNALMMGGASYTETLAVDVPPGLTGPYYVFVQADYRNQVAESDEANNNGLAPTSVDLELPPPSDLRVVSIDAPPSGSPGEPATIRWTVTNQGTNAATGTWTDAVYLSRDTVWDIDDATIGRFDRSGPLSVGQSYTGAFTAALPAVDPGAYYVLVRADVRNSVRQSEDTNNASAAPGVVTVDVPELTLGVPFEGTLVTADEHFHKILVPANETLLYSPHTEQPYTSTELFVRQGAMPSRSTFDHLFARPGEPNQEVVVPNTTGAFVFDLTRGASVPSGTRYTLTTDVVPFSIRSITPTRIGDNGPVTIVIRG